MKKKFFSLIALAFFAQVQAQQLPVYLDETKPVEQRIEDALRRSQNSLHQV